jgi:hypothetical protein
MEANKVWKAVILLQQHTCRSLLQVLVAVLLKFVLKAKYFFHLISVGADITFNVAVLESQDDF